MPTARVGAPPARDRIVPSPTSGRRLGQHLGRDHEAPGADDLRRLIRRRADQAGRAVHGEVQPRLQHAGGDQRHDGDEAFHQHGAVADQPDLVLVLDHLGRGARRDQRVEAGDGAAGDGDEQEGEQRPGEHRAGAVDEAADRRHLKVGHHEQDAERQPQDRADLEEGGEIVARRQQQPDRQHGGDETIADDGQRQRFAAEGEHRGRRRVLADDLPEIDARRSGPRSRSPTSRRSGRAAGSGYRRPSASRWGWSRRR